MQQEQTLPLSAGVLAAARIVGGYAALISTEWTRLAQCVVNTAQPNALDADFLIVGAARNPLLRDAVGATAAHTEGRDYALSAQEYMMLRDSASPDLEQAMHSHVLLLPRIALRPVIPVADFATYPLTAFLFGPYAATYAGFLNQAGISRISLYLPRSVVPQAPFARMLWIDALRPGYSAIGADFSHHDAQGKMRSYRVLTPSPVSLPPQRTPDG